MGMRRPYITPGRRKRPREFISPRDTTDRTPSATTSPSNHGEPMRAADWSRAIRSGVDSIQQAAGDADLNFVERGKATVLTSKIHVEELSRFKTSALAFLDRRPPWRTVLQVLERRDAAGKRTGLGDSRKIGSSRTYREGYAPDGIHTRGLDLTAYNRRFATRV
ncbi:hypothetical protein Bbelb_120870 [Branchiostoma belcheri]|nr:hypothetical protein Bbelb_120870 [Branchiostoma belcheri]